MEKCLALNSINDQKKWGDRTDSMRPPSSPPALCPLPSALARGVRTTNGQRCAPTRRARFPHLLSLAGQI